MTESAGRPNEPAMRLRWARAAFAVAAAALLVGYLMLPGWRLPIVVVSAIAGVAAVGVGLAVFRPQRLGAWLLVAASVVVLGTAVLARWVRTDLIGAPVVVPGVSTWLYVATYVPLPLGLWLLGRPSLPVWEWPRVLDIMAAGLAGSLLGWITIRSGLTTMHLTAAGKLAAIGAWVGYNAVFVATVRALVSWRANRGVCLLAAAVAAFLVAALSYDTELINQETSVSTAVSLGFLSFNIICGAAVLTEPVGAVATAGPTRHNLGPLRLVLLGLAMLVAPTLLLGEAISGLVTTGVAIAVVSVEVGLVILFRLFLLAQVHQRRVRLTEAVGRASKAFVVANTEDETVAAVRAAFLDMLPAGASGDVRLTDLQPHVAIGAQGLSTPEAASPKAVGELTAPLMAYADGRQASSSVPFAVDLPPARALVYEAPAVQLVELSPALKLLADEAALALHRIRLSDELHAEERERYFRTLVLTSDDVTLISRDGSIVYATPSALPMFGRDVTGEELDNLVEVNNDESRSKPGLWAAAARAEGHLTRDGEQVTVLVRSRDLSHDSTVAGVVTTLRDVTVERRLQQDLIWRATHDPLTGLANAQHFSDQLEDSGRGGSERRGTPGPGKAVFYIDLDGFKSVNDTYGHHTGDELLSATALRVQSCLRANDVAARLGGDEFAVLLRDLADVNAARDVARRMTDVLSRPITLGSVSLVCRASIGMTYTESALAGDSLLREADTALYAAKAHGKGLWLQYGVDDAKA
jgi:diguanylate cyclase (GGDEF)-like protein/PAS domain S-box-containing protein